MVHRAGLVPVLAFVLASGLALGGPALAADAPAGKSPAARTAMVAQGGKVTLAAPALSPDQLAARRPHMEALRPRARTNRE